MEIQLPTCYGRIFPALDALRYDESVKGQAFTVEVQREGIGVQAREVRLELEAWKACQACPFFRSCYDASLGALMLHTALLQHH